MTQISDIKGPWEINAGDGVLVIRSAYEGCSLNVIAEFPIEPNDASPCDEQEKQHYFDIALARARLFLAAPDLLKIAKYIEYAYAEGPASSFHTRLTEIAGGPNAFADLLIIALDQAMPSALPNGRINAAGQPDAEANARLFAAAPDLVEGLKAARAILKCIVGTDLESVIISEQVAIIDTALAKAGINV